MESSSKADTQWPETPIFAELIRQWQADGRTLPGRPDPQWERIASHATSGRRRLPVPRPSPPRGL
ncbi:hypothetical protein GCM10010193_27380 [Kitasatospora atroaurantiaca]|uniref:hypothetical protein n=1 Tax=Kitasatospora atroaurantiaca TaxID=285545 RepID=UPI0011A66BD8|nr:hypothetical protein [Kitasatospora atroaurantiaca]